ncbi:sugar phosphate isomerase/epimerase family protein [Mycolicibacterium sp. XJ1819]
MSIASDLVLYNGCLVRTAFVDFVSAAASAGFDSISVWPLVFRRAISREGMTPGRMRQALDDAGITCSEIEGCDDWTRRSRPASGADSRWRRLDFFAAAAALGADTISAVADDGPLSIDIATQGFAELCDDASAFGLRVSLEFVPFTAIPNLATGWRIVREAGRPNAALTIDMCHLIRGGFDDDVLGDIPPEYIRAIQLADGPACAPEDLLLETQYHRALPGTGEFDLATLISALSRRGVRARVGPEMFRADSDGRLPADVAADLYASTRRVLDSARR